MRLLVDAFAELRRHKGKSALTACSVFIAIVALVGVNVAGTLSRDSIVAESEQLSGRRTTVATFVGDHPSPTVLGLLADELNRSVEANPGDRWAIVGESSRPIALSDPAAPGRSVEAEGRLVVGSLQKIRRLPMVSGVFLDGTGRSELGTVVVNRAAFAALGPTTRTLFAGLPDGQGAAVRIVGIVDDGVDGPTAYLPAMPALHVAPQLADSHFAILLTSEAEVAVLRERVASVFERAGIAADVETMRVDLIDQLDRALNAAETAFLAVGAITCLVAVLGMANIGVAGARERGRELAVRRAIGFRRRRLFALVLLENVLLGLAAAFVAAAVAVVVVLGLIPLALRGGIVDAPGFPWSATAFGFLVGVGAALLGGVAPAVVAARSEISAALRA